MKEKIGLNERYEEYAIHDTDNFPIDIGEYVSIEELNAMYEMIEELPDYIVECLDEFISHYGTLEEVVEYKDDIYYLSLIHILQLHNHRDSDWYLCIGRFSVLPLLLRQFQEAPAPSKAGTRCV